jgi:hypothetical protein
VKLLIKYAAWGFIGGTFVIIILKFLGYELSNQAGIILGCTIGGLIGGIVNQRQQK